MTLEDDVRAQDKARRAAEAPYYRLTAGRSDAHGWPERADQWLAPIAGGYPMPERDPRRVTDVNYVLPLGSRP